MSGMITNDLSRNEKNVLYHLVAYPDLPDKDISEMTSLGVSTVTKIRNFLFKEDYLRTIIVPHVQRIGAELMGLGYGEINPDISMDQKLEVGREISRELTGTFLTLGDGNQAVGWGFHPNFTACIKNILYTKRVFGKEAILSTGEMHSIMASFEIAKIYRFFNYAPLIANEFGIDDPDYKEEDDYLSPGDQVRLSKKEKLVLYGLVRFPDFNDKKLSSYLNISRQTISAVKKRFQKNNYISRRNIPNIGKLGFEVVVFAHVQLKNDVSVNQDEMKEGLREDHVIQSFCHGTDIVSLSVFPDFASTKVKVSDFLKDTKARVLFAAEPTIYLFSARDLIYQLDHAYHVPLKTLLRIDTNDISMEDPIT